MYAISGKIDLGRLFENIIFLELKKRTSQNEEIDYWRNKDGIESDFVIRAGLKIKEIIQVAYELKDKKTKEREINGLVACAKENGLKEGTVLTNNFDDIITSEGIKIKFISLLKWLL